MSLLNFEKELLAQAAAIPDHHKCKVRPSLEIANAASSSSSHSSNSSSNCIVPFSPTTPELQDAESALRAWGGESLDEMLRSAVEIDGHGGAFRADFQVVVSGSAAQFKSANLVVTIAGGGATTCSSGCGDVDGFPEISENDGSGGGSGGGGGGGEETSSPSRNTTTDAHNNNNSSSSASGSDDSSSSGSSSGRLSCMSTPPQSARRRRKSRDIKMLWSLKTRIRGDGELQVAVTVCALTPSAVGCDVAIHGLVHGEDSITATAPTWQGVCEPYRPHDRQIHEGKGLVILYSTHYSCFSPADASGRANISFATTVKPQNSISPSLLQWLSPKNSPSSWPRRRGNVAAGVFSPTVVPLECVECVDVEKWGVCAKA